MPKHALLIALLGSIASCASHANKSESVADCRFLYSAEMQPALNGERPTFSAQIHDDRISIQKSGNPVCEIPSAGYPVDLVWLYPFSMKTLIYVEQSVLGTKLNLVDVEHCKVVQTRETAAEYGVDNKIVWAQPKKCGADEEKCVGEILFQLDSECKIR